MQGMVRLGCKFPYSMKFHMGNTMYPKPSQNLPDIMAALATHFFLIFFCLSLRACIQYNCRLWSFQGKDTSEGNLLPFRNTPVRPNSRGLLGRVPVLGLPSPLSPSLLLGSHPSLLKVPKAGNPQVHLPHSHSV